MQQVTAIELNPPYLVFIGDVPDATFAKTGFGLVHWRRELCLGQYRLPGARVDLGLPDLTPSRAAVAGARSLVVGVANVGGFYAPTWIDALLEAACAGLDIVAGMHTRLTELPGLAEAAAASGSRLVDVRVPPKGIPVGTGRKRTGRRLLTVGTDCAVGKKYTALTLEREMRARGMKADFRATGQTGIMIAGVGLPIDAVVADFLSGAAELLSPDNAPDHWDVIEGQGSILHPAYAAVTVGLLLGSQPDAVVLCHEAGRTTIEDMPDFQLAELPVYIERYLETGRITNRAIRCVGISVNTSPLEAARREGYLSALAEQLGLPCVDPIAGGVGPIVDLLCREL
jgi:D-glutamate N-acetyltransferase